MSRIWRVPELAGAYCSSLYHAWRYRHTFETLDRYCIFVGYPRSGHSLVGALLDAHPNVVISHELNALRFVRLGFGRRQLYSLILERSKSFARKGSRWTGFSYVVPEGWQGRYDTLLVIGDKKGGDSSRWMLERSDLIERLRETVRIRVLFVHVVRNPYDNIATMSLRTGAPLSYSIRRYFSLCEGVAKVKQRVDEDDFFDLRYESLVSGPQDALRSLCRFLGVDASDHYLDACASIVFGSPHRSREKVEWTERMIGDVALRIGHFPFLGGYSYDA